ncbi:MAG TPA: glycosyltransferase [Mycobacteriales bacterium]
MTHVAWVVDSATYGGAEQCVVQLVRGLPGLTRTVVCTEPVPDRLVRALAGAGAAVRRVPKDPRRVAAAVARADLAHVNMTDPAGCGPVLAAVAAAGPPTVADVHMTGTVDPGLAPAYRACAAVLVRSARIGRRLSAAYGLTPTVVRNGVPVGPAAGRAVGPGGRLQVRAVGRLTAQKGFDLLIEATRRLLADGVPVEVAIAGEGRDRAALTAAAHGLPVRLAGHTDDVPAFLAGADVFCLPSRAEALPLALLEAVVAGLPCVAADVGDIAAELGDLVVLVPPEDAGALTAALAGLAADPAARRRLGARARAAGLTRFDERDTIATVAATYAAITGPRGSEG